MKEGNQEMTNLRPLALKHRMGAFKWYLAIVIAFVLAVYLGTKVERYSSERQQKNMLVLEQSVKNLKHENETLTKQLNILQVEIDVATLSQQKTFEEIKQGLDREKALQKDIAFYQQIMAPELTQQGFIIDAFNVVRSLSMRSYRFEIVMTQRELIKNTLKGNLDITLVGSEDGESKQYTLQSLLVDQSQELVFGFKYFQVVEGELQLPENFQPEKILIHSDIYQFKRKKGELNSSFDWVLSNTSE